jgi:trk system potassium uptake protein TrkA
VAKKKQFAIIGLGTFGMNVAKQLAQKGAQVLAIDTDEKKINEIAPSVTQAVAADATDEKVLRSLGISEFDAGVVAIGENLESSILVTLLLRESGVKMIIVKSVSSLHSKIAVKVGADRVVYPEVETAKKLAEGLISPTMLEEIELSQEYTIAQIITPKKFINKTLRELNLRAKYGINIIAIKHKSPYLTDKNESDFKFEMNMSPKPDDEIGEGDELFVIGKETSVEKLK